jgi:hypothetical protein
MRLNKKFRLKDFDPERVFVTLDDKKRHELFMLASSNIFDAKFEIIIGEEKKDEITGEQLYDYLIKMLSEKGDEVKDIIPPKERPREIKDYCDYKKRVYAIAFRMKRAIPEELWELGKKVHLAWTGQHAIRIGPLLKILEFANIKPAEAEKYIRTLESRENGGFVIDMPDLPYKMDWRFEKLIKKFLHAVEIDAEELSANYDAFGHDDQEDLIDTLAACFGRFDRKKIEAGRRVYLPSVITTTLLRWAAKTPTTDKIREERIRDILRDMIKSHKEYEVALLKKTSPEGRFCPECHTLRIFRNDKWLCPKCDKEDLYGKRAEA